ncbi:MAG: rane protein-like protein [Frankiales bacterium]|nr:rane protein-like protein [Frankiales bacterium]
MSTPVNDSPSYEAHARSRHEIDVYERIEETEEFRELRRRFRTFVFPMTAAFLIWYLLYVILSAWARGFMAHKLFGNINVAFVFGLLQFASTFLIAWLYSRYANSRLDPLSGSIRRRVEGEL